MGSGAFRLLNISTLVGVDSHPFPPAPAPTRTERRRHPGTGHEQAVSSTQPPTGRPRTVTDDQRHHRAGPPRIAPYDSRRTGQTRTDDHRAPAPPACPSARTGENRSEPLHVSTSYRWPPSPQVPGGVHSRVRDTGLRPPLRSMAGGSYEHGPRSSKASPEGNSVRHRHPSGRTGRGNQPIDRGVDTISKQYQLCGARNSAPGSRRGRRGRRQGSTQDGNNGGGATWES